MGTAVAIKLFGLRDDVRGRRWRPLNVATVSSFIINFQPSPAAPQQMLGRRAADESYRDAAARFVFFVLR